MENISMGHSRALAVLSRYRLVSDLAGRGGLDLVLKCLGILPVVSAVEPESAEVLSAGNGGSSRLPPLGRQSLVPPVLFTDELREPDYCAYQDLMGGYDAETRAAVLRLDLRDLPKLVENELMTHAEAKDYRTSGARMVDSGFDAYDFVSYLNDLAFLRYITETTANCYRRWVAAYLDSIEHEDAILVRSWVVPYSNRFYAMVFGFLDHQAQNDDSSDDGGAESDLQMGSFRLSELKQMDLFDSVDFLGGGVESSTKGSRVDKALKEAEQMLEAQDFDSLRKEVNRKVGEYAYISGTVWAVFGAELSAIRPNGTPRYKHGQISAALFLATLMTGLRHAEWFDAILHENGYTDSRLTGITLSCPVLQVFTAKQDGRRVDNPLRDFRLIVLDNFTQEQVELIRLAIGLVAEVSKPKDAAMKDVRMQLNRVWKKMVEQGLIKETQEKDVGYRHNGVSMHTARKTFAEEVRRSMDYTRFELAAMLGHTTLMNLKYYTKARKFQPRTHGFALPRPWPGDAEDVQEWNESITNYLSGNDLARKMQELAEASAGGLSGAATWDDTLRY